MPRLVSREISGWGNYPRQTCLLARPEKRAELRELVASPELPSVIARGLGRSYGDAALNPGGGVLLCERLHRFLGWDPDTATLECEAGVSLQEIIETFLPRGYFLPVTPGTKFVTVGGAIAADVHGKNHHRDGSLAGFVESFVLLTASGEALPCSRTENPEAFWATVGGMGLTGVILTARLRLRPVESAYFTVDYQKAADLDEALEWFSKGDAGYQYSVAWIDCLATGAALGRSVLMRGNHATAAEVPEAVRGTPLETPRARNKSVPVDMPPFVLSAATIRAFNAVYYGGSPTGRRVVDYDEFFYPLDSVLNWNRMYGRRGFVQFQAVLPPGSSQRGLTDLLEALSGAGAASFLAVLKTMGPQNEGLLSFPQAGHTLALDLPNTGEPLRELLQELDEVVLRCGGRVYLAKDASLSPQAFAQMYPRLPEFREIKARLDPESRFQSSLARRLGIVEAA